MLGVPWLTPDCVDPVAGVLVVVPGVVVIPGVVVVPGVVVPGVVVLGWVPVMLGVCNPVEPCDVVVLGCDPAGLLAGEPVVCATATPNAKNKTKDPR